MTALTCVIVFESVHQAIRAEKVLQGEGMVFEMIPTPREISASCGQSIEVPREGRVAAEKSLRDAGVQIKAVYSRDKARRSFERLDVEKQTDE